MKQPYTEQTNPVSYGIAESMQLVNTTVHMGYKIWNLTW